ncbi:hypothetical protein GQX73_g2195 [Xylaria multiplex]|uniref:Uncharacterized protein n=1 Tax=Xylaria multiplex TaxID=323545 RepID=A0A7C8IUI5_9PEZI|nr:hypothetical protein GQX73_g2195 [Xylaria multiplex]
MGNHSSGSKHKKSKTSHLDKNKDGSKSSTSTRNPPSSYGGYLSLSFLFVVNELLLDPHARPNLDQWGTAMPPFDSNHYEGEAAGTVFRYHDGVVEVARGYYWERDVINLNSTMRPAGSIYLAGGDDGRDPPWEMTKYSQYTVFNCWRPLPCVYMENDPLCTRIGPYSNGPPLTLMSFEEPDITGITHITTGGSSQVVAGRDPTWIPSLVPEMFRNPDRNAPVSRGLGGLLPVIIGQMALTQPHGHTDRPFLSRWWHNGHWRRRDLGTTVSHPLSIRGVVVHVALDEFENREGSTKETLENFEAGAVVREN